jgi:hypothetical protein
MQLRSSPSRPACIRQHPSAYVSIRQHTSASVSIRQHPSECCRFACRSPAPTYTRHCSHTQASVSIRRHPSACVIKMRAGPELSQNTLPVSVRRSLRRLRRTLTGASCGARKLRHKLYVCLAGASCGARKLAGASWQVPARAFLRTHKAQKNKGSYKRQ